MSLPQRRLGPRKITFNASHIRVKLPNGQVVAVANAKEQTELLKAFEMAKKRLSEYSPVNVFHGHKFGLQEDGRIIYFTKSEK